MSSIAIKAIFTQKLELLEKTIQGFYLLKNAHKVRECLERLENLEKEIPSNCIELNILWQKIFQDSLFKFQELQSKNDPFNPSVSNVEAKDPSLGNTNPPSNISQQHGSMPTNTNSLTTGYQKSVPLVNSKPDNQYNANRSVVEPAIARINDCGIDWTASTTPLRSSATYRENDCRTTEIERSNSHNFASPKPEAPMPTLPFPKPKVAETITHNSIQPTIPRAIGSMAPTINVKELKLTTQNFSNTTCNPTNSNPSPNSKLPSNEEAKVQQSNSSNSVLMSNKQNLMKQIESIRNFHFLNSSNQVTNTNTNTKSTNAPVVADIVNSCNSHPAKSINSNNINLEKKLELISNDLENILNTRPNSDEFKVKLEYFKANVLKISDNDIEIKTKWMKKLATFNKQDEESLLEEKLISMKSVIEKQFASDPIPEEELENNIMVLLDTINNVKEPSQRLNEWSEMASSLLLRFALI